MDAALPRPSKRQLSVAYLHVETHVNQIPKRKGAVCGDVVRIERTAECTTLICSDGVGSGVRANVAANLCVARLLEYHRLGHSVREAFTSLVRTMNQMLEQDAHTNSSYFPYAVFTVVHILREGQTTLLTYEMPPPILISRHGANVVEQRTHTVGKSLVGEAVCTLEQGDGILVVSDGITQAGLGRGLPMGWGIEGTCRHVRSLVSFAVPHVRIPEEVLKQALQVTSDQSSPGDDCTVALASCRKGKVVNVLTGPPVNPSEDTKVVGRFLQTTGKKVVCGGTTSGVVGRISRRQVKLVQDRLSPICPPHYEIKGIDLVTEGAVTLNQVFNVLDEDPSRLEIESGVRKLCELLHSADRINFTVGRASNPGSGDISFQQQGILPRSTIIPLIAEKLLAKGKLVVVDWT
jgi:hypothetical protein